eukprot:tig00001284_g8003.t1
MGRTDGGISTAHAKLLALARHRAYDAADEPELDLSSRIDGDVLAAEDDAVLALMRNEVARMRATKQEEEAKEERLDDELQAADEDGEGAEGAPSSCPYRQSFERVQSLVNKTGNGGTGPGDKLAFYEALMAMSGRQEAEEEGEGRAMAEFLAEADSDAALAGLRAGAATAEEAGLYEAEAEELDAFDA